MTEIRQKYEALKKEWIGKRVEIMDKKHPWYQHTGKIVSFDNTAIGIGIKIRLDVSFDECYVFKGCDLKKI